MVLIYHPSLVKYMNLFIFQLPCKYYKKFHLIPSLCNNTTSVLYFLSLPWHISKCSPALSNIITPLFIYPAPLYTFAIFQCQLWTFEEFLLEVLLDLTARAIFPVLLPPLSLSVSLHFHRCDSHSSLDVIVFLFCLSFFDLAFGSPTSLIQGNFNSKYEITLSNKTNAF